jgi:hypothetical protein
MKNVHYSKMAGYTLHYYCGGMECRGFTKDEWYEQFRRADKMQEVIDKAWGFIVGYGMQKEAQLVIDEWGAWHRRGTPAKGGSGPSNGMNLYEQQCTMRDAIVVGLNLNMFNNNCEKIRMTNVAQLMNNIQSLFLAGGEHCIVTPAYHVFDMFKDHMGGTAIRTAIEGWTRESGVRNLERLIAKLCRKADLKLVEDEELKKVTVNAKNLTEFLGTRYFQPEELLDEDPVGLVTGLAWTSVGGETLEVEVNVMEGSGKIELTGNLGLVMQESARAAVSYIRSHARELGVDPDFYKNCDIHVHFPEGAIPKDGPSAGVTVTTAIVSALTGRTVRRDVAMTGEISLRGRVMAIGGLKEKTMAAFRHGCKTVIIPAANERDLQDIDQTVRSKLNFVIAKEIGTVLETALNPAVAAPEPVAIPAEPPRQRAAAEICQ